MLEKILFKHMKFAREMTIAALDATPEQLSLKIPSGYTNNLLWNFGHIFWAQDVLLHSFVNEKHEVPKIYEELFKRGSRPDGWTIEPPSLEEVRSYLVEQPDRMIDHFSGKLLDKGDQPFDLGFNTQLTTPGEVLGFVTWHEGLHLGAINGIKRALGVENLWVAKK